MFDIFARHYDEVSRDRFETDLAEKDGVVMFSGGSSFGASQVISGLNEAATFPVVGLANGEITVAWTRKAAEEHEHDEQARPDMRDPKSVMGLKEVGQAAVIVRRAKLSGAMP